jgi:hypothetical protein
VREDKYLEVIFEGIEDFKTFYEPPPLDKVKLEKLTKNNAKI